MQTLESAWDRSGREAFKDKKNLAQFYTDELGDFRHLQLSNYVIPGREPCKLAVHSDDGASVFIVESTEENRGLPKDTDRPQLARFNVGQDFTRLGESFQVVNYVLKPNTYYNIFVFYSNIIHVDKNDADGLSLYLFPAVSTWFALRVDSNMDGNMEGPSSAADDSIKQDKTSPMILDVNNGDADGNNIPDNEQAQATPDAVTKFITPSKLGHEFPRLNLVLRPSRLPKGYKVVISKKNIEGNPEGVMRVFAPEPTNQGAGVWVPIIDRPDREADITQMVVGLGNDANSVNPPTLHLGLETYSYGLVEIKAEAQDATKKQMAPVTMFTDKLFVEGNVDRYFDGKKVQALKDGEPQRPVQAGVMGLINKPSGAGKIDAIRCHFSCSIPPVITRYRGELRNNFNETRITGQPIAKTPNMSVWIGLQSKDINTRSSNPEGWIQGGLLIRRPLAGGQTVDAYVEAGSQPIGGSVLSDKERNAAFQKCDNDIIILRNRAIRQAVMLIKTGEKWNVLKRKVGIPDGYDGETYFKAFMEADFNTVQATCEMPFTTTNIPGSASNPVKWENIEVGYLKDEKIKESAKGVDDPGYAKWVLDEGYNWIALDGPEPHIHVPNGKQVDAVIPPIGKEDTYHYHAEIKKETDGRVVVKAWDTRN